MKTLKSVYISLLFVCVVLLNIESTWAQEQEVVFNFTGAQQSFVVPPGVTSIHIQAWGAQGGDGMGSSTGLGGLGGFAEGELAVTHGQTLEIFVGGQGTTVSAATGGGGFNGGGDARSQNTEQLRGGGGGASDVRIGGITFDDRVIVAAGAGGGCGNNELNGGDGGGLDGANGDGGGGGGSGGTQFAGGAGGAPCFDGEFGIGGDTAPTNNCAGGGAGWFGGGSGCGAAGGSSYIDGVENGTTTPGVREGDGLVIISFIPGPRPIPTLSEWGMIAMAGLIGIIGFIAVRRRTAAI